MSDQVGRGQGSPPGGGDVIGGSGVWGRAYPVSAQEMAN